MTERKYRRRLGLRSVMSGEKCAVCGENTTGGTDIICPGCREKLAYEEGRYCMSCGRAVRDCLCARPCMTDAGCNSFVKLYFYGGTPDFPQNRIIYRLKNVRDTMLHDMLAEKLAAKLDALMNSRLILKDEAVICFVPRSRARAFAAGTDQAREMARALSEKSGIRFMPLIERASEGDAQKQLDAAERQKNVRGMFSVCDPEGCLFGRTAILVDDLVTTGATVAECTRILRDAGAEDVICVAPVSAEL